MLGALRVQFESQRQQILTNLKSTPYKSYRVKALTKKQKQELLAGLLIWSTATTALKDSLAPVLYGLIIEAGQDATQQVGRQPSQFDASSAAIIAYYQARADKIATDVNAETEKQLRASISQGLDSEEDPNELQARVEEVMGAALTYRADRIAQTEVTRGQGWADVEAWKQSGIVTGKQWYTVLDERTCSFCNDLDGTIVSLDSDFYSLGDTVNVDGKSLAINYDDVGSPPLHVNCRCTLMDVTVDLGSI